MKAHWLSFILLLTSAAFAAGPVPGEALTRLSRELESIRIEGGVEAYRVPRAWADEYGNLPLARIFENGGRSSVFLTASEHGDFSLVVRGSRQNAKDMIFAGVISGTPLVKLEADAVMRPGVWIQFDDLPASVVPQLKGLIRDSVDTYSLSCVNAACALLSEAGIQVAGGDRLPIFRREAMERLLVHGVKTADGQPVQMKVFVSSNKSFDELMRRLSVMDRLIRRQALRSPELARADLVEVERTVGNRMSKGTRETVRFLIEGGVPVMIVSVAQAVSPSSSQ